MNLFLLDEPYVSDFLIDTIKKNDFRAFDNKIAHGVLDEKFLVKDPKNINLLYSNSENSLEWIIKSCPDIAPMIKLSKDKALFRETLKPLYPDYFFKKVSLDELKKINPDELKFPLILKPNTGFLSFGVYTIKTPKIWNEIILKLNNDIKKFENIFPKCVVNTNSFIIEELIEGDEYALDAYFNDKNEAVILNIFKHPFFDENDVSDRAYYTSKEIISNNLKKFQDVLNKIAKLGNYKNFPFHLELRMNESNIIPIEINPLRFCGWCITDIAKWAWNINVYEYFFKSLKPNWDEILKNADDSYYYFTIGDIPNDIKNETIKSVDYNKYLKNISNPLTVRKIDYKTKPIFAIVFAKTDSLNEIKNILALNMHDFIL